MDEHALESLTTSVTQTIDDISNNGGELSMANSVKYYRDFREHFEGARRAGKLVTSSAKLIKTPN
jgi:hypothetical protein